MWYPTGPDKTPRILLPCPGNDHTDIEPGMIGIKDESNDGATWVRPFRDSEGDPEPAPIRLATVDDVSAVGHVDLAGDNNSDAAEQHYNSTPATGGSAIEISDGITGNPSVAVEQRDTSLIRVTDIPTGVYRTITVGNLHTVVIDSAGGMLVFDRVSHRLQYTHAGAGLAGPACLIDDNHIAQPRPSSIRITDIRDHTYVEYSIPGLSTAYCVCCHEQKLHVLDDADNLFVISTADYSAASYSVGLSYTAMSIAVLGGYAYVVDCDPVSGLTIYLRKIDVSDGSIVSSATVKSLVTTGGRANTVGVHNNQVTVVYAISNQIDHRTSMFDIGLTPIHAGTADIDAYYGTFLRGVFYTTDATDRILTYSLPGLSTQSPSHSDRSLQNSSAVAELRHPATGDRIYHSDGDFQRAAIQASTHDSTRQVFDVISDVASSATEITDAVPGQRYRISDSTQHNNQLFEMQSDGAHWYPPTDGGRVFDHSIAAYVRYDASRGKWSPETFKGDVDVKWTGTQTVSLSGSSNIFAAYSIDDSILEATGEAVSFEILATGTVVGQNRQLIRKIFGTLGYPSVGTDDGGVALASVDEVDSITTIAEVTSVLMQPRVEALNDATNPGRIKVTITVTCSSAPTSFDIDWDIRLRGFIKTGAGDFCS